LFLIRKQIGVIWFLNGSKAKLSEFKFIVAYNYLNNLQFFLRSLICCRLGIAAINVGGTNI
jgi:hypothetical protein